MLNPPPSLWSGAMPRKCILIDAPATCLATDQGGREYRSAVSVGLLCIGALREVGPPSTWCSRGRRGCVMHRNFVTIDWSVASSRPPPSQHALVGPASAWASTRDRRGGESRNLFCFFCSTNPFSNQSVPKLQGTYCCFYRHIKLLFFCNWTPRCIKSALHSFHSVFFHHVFLSNGHGQADSIRIH